ncbi:MAG: hypothetical protein Q9202_005585 [Teloschistes flavicans]
MSANNSSLKGVLGSKYKTVNLRAITGGNLELKNLSQVGVTEDPKTAEDPSQRRRSSSITKFNGLMNQKRDSTDAAAAARKASFAEQSKAPGVFGGLWQRSCSIMAQT